MSRIPRLIGLALLSAGLTGCVAQDKYTASSMERSRLAEQLGEAQREASTARVEADAYRNQLQQLMGKSETGDALRNNILTENATLRAQVDDLNRRYEAAMQSVGQQGNSPLPVALTTELNKFAAQNPDLVDFDSGRGIVKFKSDVTFAVGDAQVTDKARDAIVRFSQILNSPAASSYELLVAGHTDSAPVHNPTTISRGHKDNWYLSSHRAISVGGELVKDGVDPSRLGVVGYADKRPIASNVSEAGKAQNRRVEVLILPTTVRAGAAQAGARTAGAERPAKAAAKQPALNKDSSASAPAGPVFNK